MNNEYISIYIHIIDNIYWCLMHIYIYMMIDEAKECNLETFKIKSSIFYWFYAFVGKLSTVVQLFYRHLWCSSQ